MVLLKLVELGMGECGNIGEVFRLDTLMTSLLVKFAHEVGYLYPLLVLVIIDLYLYYL